MFAIANIAVVNPLLDVAMIFDKVVKVVTNTRLSRSFLFSFWEGCGFTTIAHLFGVKEGSAC